MSGPLTVVTSGSNINTTTAQQLITNTSIPFTKLDTQNNVSFQTISLLFNHEPTQPPSGAPYYSNTQVYQFPHGYNYIPAIWLTWYNSSPEYPTLPTSGNSTTTYRNFGDDSNSINLAIDAAGDGPATFTSSIAFVQHNSSGTIYTVTDSALICTVDTSNIYLSVVKETLATVGGNVIPLYLAGVTLNLRCYVFAEPASTTSY